MAGYLKDDKLKSKEDFVVRIETFPETLHKFFKGENFWKLGLQVRGGLDRFSQVV